MFDRLDDLLRKFEEIMNALSEPDVANDQQRFRALMKEQSDLTPIVNAYKEYKKCNQDIEDSVSMLESESDEDMREMLKEELSASKRRVEELEKELKILLLPKDPNDEKNVIVEIRAGAGGDEFVEAVYQASAAGHDDAVGGNVGYQFRGGALQDGVDGFHDALYGFLEGVHHFRGADRYHLREAGQEAAAFYVHGGFLFLREDAADLLLHFLGGALANQ